MISKNSAFAILDDVIIPDTISLEKSTSIGLAQPGGSPIKHDLLSVEDIDSNQYLSQVTSRPGLWQQICSKTLLFEGTNP